MLTETFILFTNLHVRVSEKLIYVFKCPCPDKLALIYQYIIDAYNCNL